MIAHATASAFLLGAVAGYLSILAARLQKVADRERAMGATSGGAHGVMTTDAPTWTRS